MKVTSYRPAEDYPGYRVGDDGSVWKWLKGSYGVSPRWKRLKCFVRRGYLSVGMTRDGVKKSFWVATLVLRSFGIPRPLGFAPFLYPDTDPENCSLENLRWAPKGTKQLRGRLKPARRFAASGEGHHAAKLSSGDVVEIRKMARSGDFNFAEIGERFGIDNGHARRIARGQERTEVEEDAVEVPVNGGRLKGDRNPNSKLTTPQVKAIRKLAAKGFQFKWIAERFGIASSNVSAIVSRRNWRHVD